MNTIGSHVKRPRGVSDIAVRCSDCDHAVTRPRTATAPCPSCGGELVLAQPAAVTRTAWRKSEAARIAREGEAARREAEALEKRRVAEQAKMDGITAMLRAAREDAGRQCG